MTLSKIPHRRSYLDFANRVSKTSVPRCIQSPGPIFSRARQYLAFLDLASAHITTLVDILRYRCEVRIDWAPDETFREICVWA
jgi:hypothetical protein